MSIFSERLTKLRGTRRRTEVAMGVGISYQPYVTYENGRTEPTYDNLVRICRYFGVTADYLIGNTDDKGANFNLSNTNGNNYAALQQSNNKGCENCPIKVQFNEMTKALIDMVRNK